MLKWIVLIFVVFGVFGGYLSAKKPAYTKLSEQANVDGKIHSPSMALKTWSKCAGNCRNYSSSSYSGK